LSLEELNKDERYRIEGRVGSGAMATVYKAYDLRLHRIVALKILHEHLSSQSELRMRFEQEAKLAARIDHPNVVRIYDFGINNNGQLFIVSEFIDGRSLTLAQRKYSSQPSPALHPVLAALVAVEIAKGIEAAHRHSVVHRDLKPDNVLVHINGEVKLTDFGVARPFDSSMTQAGQFIGSLTYASPEQIQSGKVDARSDIFSFGVILFELLTGQLPFRSSSPTDLAIKITQANVPPLNQLRPSVPIDLDVLVRRCLRADPAQRPQSAEQIVLDLTRYLSTQEVVPSSRVIADGFENPMLFASTIQRSPLLQHETRIVADARVSNLPEERSGSVAEAEMKTPIVKPHEPELKVDTPAVKPHQPELKVDAPALKPREPQPLARRARAGVSGRQNPATPGQALSRPDASRGSKGLLSFILLTVTATALLLAFVFRERQRLQEYISGRSETPTTTAPTLSPSPTRGSDIVSTNPPVQTPAAPVATSSVPRQSANESTTSSISPTPLPSAPASVRNPLPTPQRTFAPTVQKTQTPKTQLKSNTQNKNKPQKPATQTKVRPPARPAKPQTQNQSSSAAKTNRQPQVKLTPVQSAATAAPTQLIIRTEPGEMTIYINGVFEGLSSRSGLNRVFSVPSGNVLLHIPQQEHSGKKYQEFTKRLRIESGKTLELPVINLNSLDPDTKKEQ
jgi:serine/threonine protein kinase